MMQVLNWVGLMVMRYQRPLLVLVAVVVALIALTGESEAFSVYWPCDPTWWSVFFGCW